MESITRNIKRRPLLQSVEIVRISNLAKGSTFMNQEKYIGMDVHQATISVASLQFAVENFWRRPANRCGRNLQSLEPSGFKRQPVVWCS
jgi:hypothetical protein